VVQPYFQERTNAWNIKQERTKGKEAKRWIEWEDETY